MGRNPTAIGASGPTAGGLSMTDLSDFERLAAIDSGLAVVTT